MPCGGGAFPGNTPAKTDVLEDEIVCNYVSLSASLAPSFSHIRIRCYLSLLPDVRDLNVPLH
jgi:hypothetical protein